MTEKPDISTLVNEILEGLQGDAFLLARDLGVEALMSGEELEQLLQATKSFMFPGATEEANFMVATFQIEWWIIARLSS